MNINLAIAERARAGEALTAAEIDELGSADILSLGMLADEVRRARVGDTVTYSRVIEIVGAKGQRDLSQLGPVLRPIHLDHFDGRQHEPRQRHGANVLVPGRRHGDRLLA